MKKKPNRHGARCNRCGRWVHMLDVIVDRDVMVTHHLTKRCRNTNARLTEKANKLTETEKTTTHGLVRTTMNGIPTKSFTKSSTYTPWFGTVSPRETTWWISPDAEKLYAAMRSGWLFIRQATDESPVIVPNADARRGPEDLGDPEARFRRLLTITFEHLEARPKLMAAAISVIALGAPEDFARFILDHVPGAWGAITRRAHYDRHQRRWV